ncbi:sensor histidine kinase [Canibacter zhoujuaniae]|uniref:sensor histidine kinase n=1 Tax=Canibacter zhoujuaniae TaxID=2708343 RepID=UPI001423911F|nr:HAMP domain-containing sensor histidine kinase [Canibacter zhoujuaniae]
MTESLVLVVVTALITGGLSAGIVVLVGKRSLRLALLLAPLVSLLSVGAGLIVGVDRMLIQGSMTSILLILGGATPVAIVSGAFAAHRVAKQLEHNEKALAEERAARELTESRREMMAWMSHDIRTPIAGIRAMAEALSDGMASDPEAYYREILSQAERTSDMVSDLMSLANLEQSIQGMQREPVDMADVVSDLVMGLRPLTQERHITLTGSAEAVEGSAEVLGDASLLSRAVQNLLVNAITYSEAEGTVSVRVRANDAAVEVCVTDSCGGLAAEHIDRMTEPGWRGDLARTPSTSSGSPGSGLGLAIAKQIVTGHGGELRIVNAGEGCAVTLALPAALRCSSIS